MRPKRTYLVVVVIAFSIMVNAVGSEQSTHPPHFVSSERPLNEYPRPQLVRKDWLNLNGMWEFGITHRDNPNRGRFDGKIVVPFPVESALSGIKRPINEQQRLWYRRKFDVPPGWQNRHVLLHFGAVDWEARVWINGIELGGHRGGYDDFSFDISQELSRTNQQELIVSVFDPTSSGNQPRGVQSLGVRAGTHAACSGIWQTVWVEPVEADFIESLSLVPDVDSSSVRISAFSRNDLSGSTVEAVVHEGKREIGRTNGLVGQVFALSLPDAKLWSPSDPFLYDVKVTLWHNGREIDNVTSYFGLRKVSLGKNSLGLPQIMLNNEPLFTLSVSEQGYWPDGLYTPPSDQALQRDIRAAKALGFNACRQFGKVECDRWYYWCDKLGFLVWQDMPGMGRRISPGAEFQPKPEAARQFESELHRLIQTRGNHPSIIGWIPFGGHEVHYDIPRILLTVKNEDPSRLVASTAANDEMLGDILLLSEFQGMASLNPGDPRARVLADCGEFEFRVPNHSWPTKPSWVQKSIGTAEQLLDEYTRLAGNLRSLEEKAGFSGAIFSQLNDIEAEENGLITYDRTTFKLRTNVVALINSRLVKAPGQNDDPKR